MRAVFNKIFVSNLFSFLLLVSVLTLAGCNTTTKLAAESDRLIGRNFAILSTSRPVLTRIVQVQHVSTGSFAADLIINAVGSSVRATGKTAHKTNQILAPNFNPNTQLTTEITSFLQSKYKVQLYPAINGVVKIVKGSKWPDIDRAASIGELARSQGFDGVVLDFVITTFKAESTGSSINKSGGDVLLGFGGKFALVDSKTGKILAAGGCLASKIPGVKLDNVISQAAIQSNITKPELVENAEVKKIEGGSVPVLAPQSEPNQQYVDAQFKARVSACANRIIKDALL